jgi:3',5'-cyclic AMP phosphodiesterase CpdA
LRVVRAFSILFSATCILCSSNLIEADDRDRQPQEIPHNTPFLAQEPSFEIHSNGSVEITAVLAKACSGGEVYAGIFPEAAELSYPIYRLAGTFILSDSLHVIARFYLGDLESPRIDVNDFRKHHGGRIAVRLLFFGPEARVVDRNLGYSRDDEGLYHRASALVEGPFVDCVTDTSAIISFEFDQGAEGSLWLLPTDQTVHFSENQSKHEIRLSGLAPKQTYRYGINYQDRGRKYSSPEYAFRTVPSPGSMNSFRFAVLSDCRVAFGGAESDVEGINLGVLKTLLNLAYSREADFILFPGDLVGGSSSDPLEMERQFRSFKRAAEPVGSRMPIYEGMGNHDQSGLWIAGGSSRDFLPRRGDEAGEVLFARHFVNPENGPAPAGAEFPPYSETVYSFDWGSAHFVMLNSNYIQKGSGEKVAQLHGQLQGEMRAEQLNWLESDLEAARQRGQKPLFVFAHEPAFPNGGHAGDGMWWNGRKPEILAIRQRFWKILCAHQVTAAFFGHEHNYSRTLIDSRVDPEFDTPVWQIITGGGGAPYYNRDKSVPWADAVKAFYPLTHLCLLDVDGEEVRLTVLSEAGLTIEQVVLSRE